MAEYSRIAQGLILPTSQSFMVNLPFTPTYVRVDTLDNSTVTGTGANIVKYAWWNSFMRQGDAVILAETSGGNNLQFAAGYPNGISTFSAGLDFQFGPPLAISSITKANPAVVTTASPHNLSTGDVVIFQSITGMKQITGIPFVITVTGSSSFTIPWNTNQTNYTAVSAGTLTEVLFPNLYSPGISVISNIGLGTSTTVTCTAPHNLVVNQEVAFRITPAWGTTQLDSLPNVVVPGSPIYGYVTFINSPTQVTVSINSSAFTAFNSNVAFAPGLTSAQLVAVGDINSFRLVVSCVLIFSFTLVKREDNGCLIAVAKDVG